MKKTGELLKQKRESVDLSLSEVALATKINPKVLSAIEAGDESNLPARTILKGFVRSYALYLKMDVDEVVRTFIAETGGPTPSPLHEALQKGEGAAGSGRAVDEESSAGLRTAAVVVIVLLIGLIIGIRELVDKYHRERIAASTPADVKVSPLADQPPVTESSATEAPAPEAPAKEAPAAVPPTESAPAATAAASAPKPTPVVDKVDLSSIIHVPKILEIPVDVKHEPASEAPPQPVDVAVVEAKPEATAEPVTAPTPAPAAEATTPAAAADGTLKNEVIIEALDRVEVKFQVAGESKQVALAPNEVQVIRAEGAVIMDFSDGGAVSLVHNGRVRGVPGKLGEPKQVKFQ